MQPHKHTNKGTCLRWHFFCSIFSLFERHLISFFLTEHASLSSALIGFQFHQDSTQLGHRLPTCLPGLFEAIVHRCADRVLHQTLKQCQLTYFFDVLFQKKVQTDNVLRCMCDEVLLG